MSIRLRAIVGLVGVLVVAAVVVIVLVARSGGGSDNGASLPTPTPAPTETPHPGPSPAWVSRSGSTLMLDGHPWRATGVNEYWLGLDDNISDSEGATYPSDQAIDQGLSAAKKLGAKLVRATTLGVSVGGPRTLEPALGQFNNDAFGPIDYAVAKAQQDGLRLMIPLTDQGHYYHGGKHTFTNWTGHPDIPGENASDPAQREQESAFYTDPKTIAAFHAYVRHLLDHVNPYTGVRLGDDPTIAIWETGNELYDAPPSWTEQTAAFIKTLAPKALVADGSDSTGVDIQNTAVDEPDVDIIDAHFYPVDTAKAVAQASYTAAHDKAYLIGEYPLTGSAATTSHWLSTIAKDRDISGDLAWTLLPILPDGSPEPHGEAYTFHYPGATPQERAWDRLLKHHAAQMTRDTPSR